MPNSACASEDVQCIEPTAKGSGCHHGLGFREKADGGNPKKREPGSNVKSERFLQSEKQKSEMA
jgi:hypothetical protein